MEKSNDAPVWRRALLPVEALAMGIVLAGCIWLSVAALALAIRFTLGHESAAAFTSGFGSGPVVFAAFGFGAVRAVWSAKAVGGARSAVGAMALLFVLGVALATLSDQPWLMALSSLAPFVGGLLFAATRVGRSG